MNTAETQQLQSEPTMTGFRIAGWESWGISSADCQAGEGSPTRTVTHLCITPLSQPQQKNAVCNYETPGCSLGAHRLTGSRLQTTEDLQAGS